MKNNRFLHSLFVLKRIVSPGFSVFFFFFMLILTSCKKEPGEGGAATIRGKLLCGNYNSPATAVAADDGIADESVYIVYGDNAIPDHNEKTSHDGSFEFRFLRKGAYTIYAYSVDKESPTPIETLVSRTIEIKEKKETVEVNDFVIYKEADKGGNSTIKGKVFLRDYDIAFANSVPQNQYYKSDEDVFIIFGNDTINDDNTKTSFDGSFQFDGLRKGVYQVYAFSKDSAKIHDCWGCSIYPDSAVIKTVEITENRQVILLPDIVILKN